MERGGCHVRFWRRTPANRLIAPVALLCYYVLTHTECTFSDFFPFGIPRTLGVWLKRFLGYIYVCMILCFQVHTVIPWYADMDQISTILKSLANIEQQFSQELTWEAAQVPINRGTNGRARRTRCRERSALRSRKGGACWHLRPLGDS